MKASDRYLKLVYWSEEQQAYVGRCPGLYFEPVQGEDELEVYTDLVQGIEDWIRTCQDDGVPLPAPTAGRTYSGKFNLRVGGDLHEQLAMESARASESLNKYCVKLLREGVSR
ncbi:MAG: toxin-antitoxin system HicB family antitoxin [Xanthomonadales bacterium]|nr:toxin-antitoxin system HicB family antitoxin [Xanthomonadales bacterium]NIX13960.1 toxin-antitoxin system HicB family antitoxin [Xanthomonadales bacterium]